MGSGRIGFSVAEWPDAVILSLMLGFTPADARMKRSQSAKVEFKHQPHVLPQDHPKAPAMAT